MASFAAQVGLEEGVDHVAAYDALISGKSQRGAELKRYFKQIVEMYDAKVSALEDYNLVLKQSHLGRGIPIPLPRPATPQRLSPTSSTTSLERVRSIEDGDVEDDQSAISELRIEYCPSVSSPCASKKRRIDAGRTEQVSNYRSLLSRASTYDAYASKRRVSERRDGLHSCRGSSDMSAAPPFWSGSESPEVGPHAGERRGSPQGSTSGKGPETRLVPSGNSLSILMRRRVNKPSCSSAASDSPKSSLRPESHVARVRKSTPHPRSRRRKKLSAPGLVTFDNSPPSYGTFSEVYSSPHLAVSRDADVSSNNDESGDLDDERSSGRVVTKDEALDEIRIKSEPLSDDEYPGRFDDVPYAKQESVSIEDGLELLEDEESNEEDSSFEEWNVTPVDGNDDRGVKNEEFGDEASETEEYSINAQPKHQKTDSSANENCGGNLSHSAAQFGFAIFEDVALSPPASPQSALSLGLSTTSNQENVDPERSTMPTSICGGLLEDQSGLFIPPSWWPISGPMVPPILSSERNELLAPISSATEHPDGQSMNPAGLDRVSTGAGGRGLPAEVQEWFSGVLPSKSRMSIPGQRRQELDPALLETLCGAGNDNASPAGPDAAPSRTKEEGDSEGDFSEEG